MVSGVAPQPKVLLVESQNGAADRLREALQPAGVLADVRAARRLPTQLSELDAYELLSEVGKAHVTEMVDPNYVVIASIEKKYLPRKII